MRPARSRPSRRARMSSPAPSAHGLTRGRARTLARTLVTPKWLALAVVLVMAVGACVLLGRWQWQRTQDILAAERVAAATPVQVEDLFAADEPMPAQAIGRPVIASGTYRGEGRVIVRHRASADGIAGAWILQPLDLQDGSTIGVLRGWVADDGDPAAVAPAGRVRVQGILHPPEAFYPDAINPPGTAVAISDAVMRGAWGPGVRDGFVMLSSEQPAGGLTPQSVPPTIQTGDVPFPLQNFFYAFQWWIFGGFAVALYARWLWLDTR